MYKTKDLGTAGYLIAEGVAMEEAKLEGNLVYFYFKDVALCEKMEKEYRFNQAKVVARKFNDAIRNLKSEVFALKNQSPANFHK